MNASLINIGSNPEPGTLNPEPSVADNGPSRQSETKAEPLTTDAPHATHVTDLTHVTDVTDLTYPEPSPDLIAGIRRRLAELPPDVAQYVDEALRREPIEHVANFLWKAGHSIFMSSELYEYRRTLFPPDAMVDPYTAGPPILQDRSADSLSVSAPTTANGSLINENDPVSHSSNHPAIHSSVPPAGAALLNDLRDVLSRYVVLPEMAAEALALWVVHTYAFTLRQVTTYIGVVSPEKRCGKTTLLELLALLANRSLTAANISPSALFRVIEETQPTLLIDEADTFLQGRDELAGILNAGYRKGNSYVVRVADRKPRKPVGPVPSPGTTEPEFAQWTPELPRDSSVNPSIHQSINPPSNPTIHSSNNPTIPANSGGTDFTRYSTWCPKVMAAIGRLPDTLADRCILITMQRKMPAQKCERIRQLNATDFRRRCADFVRQHPDEIAQARPDIPSSLNDRAADIWEPLFAIADLAGDEWPQLARDAARKLSASDDDLTLIAYFLKDLRNLMIVRNVDRILSRDIVSSLNPLHDRAWEDLRRGREINEWWLGWQLRQLGIRTKTMRVGAAMGKGYALADIEAAFRRYVPNADIHLNDVGGTSDTSPQSPASPKHEISNLKASDDAPLKCEISNVKSPDPETQTDAKLDRLLKQILATLANESS